MYCKQNKTSSPAHIHENQRGFMKGRYIGENTRIVYDIIQISNKHKIPGMILLVDIEKAFDSVSWSVMYKSLHFFNFGPDIIRWVKTLHADAKLCVIQNGIFLSFSILVEDVDKEPQYHLTCLTYV